MAEKKQVSAAISMMKTMVYSFIIFLVQMVYTAVADGNVAWLDSSVRSVLGGVVLGLINYIKHWNLARQ